MNLLRILDKPEKVRLYIFGQKLENLKSTVDLGVDRVISQIYDGLPPPKDFNIFFGTPAR